MNTTCYWELATGPLQINYLQLHYCQMSSYPMLSGCILCCWMILLFYLLGSTADGYFSPTLSSICEKLNISYDVAGVTLLAFGNGAPDVFSSIAAFSSGSGATGLNALLGGGAFVTSVVVGVVILTSEVSVHPRAFQRDCFTYLLALGILVFLGMYKHITLSLALLFPILYGAYVLLVILGDCWSRYYSSKSVQFIKNSSNCVMSAFWHVDINHSMENSSNPKYSFVTREDAAIESGNGNELELSKPYSSGTTFSGQVVEDYFPPISDSLSSPLISSNLEDNNVHNEKIQGIKTSGGSVWESLYWSHLRWRQDTKRHVYTTVINARSNVCIKFFALIQLPFIFMRDITIPLLENESWSRLLASCFPVTTPLFLCLVSGYFTYDMKIGHFHAPLCIWIILFGTGLGILIYFKTHRSRAPKSFCFTLCFLFIAFLANIAWIYTIASELVAVLEAIGRLTGINQSLMGLTILAWGNSIGDLITNVSVARAGFPEMAIAGCYGGPVFNLLIGMGVSMIYAILTDSTHLYNLELDIHVVTSLACLFFGLISSLLITSRYEYQFPRYFGYVLICLYIIYTLLQLVEAFHSLETKKVRFS